MQNSLSEKLGAWDLDASDGVITFQKPEPGLGVGQGYQLFTGYSL